MSNADVRLADYAAGHRAALARLRADPALQHLLLAHPVAPSDGDFDEWVARRLAEPSGMFKTVMIDGAAAGFAQIVRVHRVDRYGYAGICLAAEHRRKGAGLGALTLLKRHARESMGLRKLLVEVANRNAAGLKVHMAAGFSIVGVMARHYFDGREFHDVALLEVHLDGQAA